MIEDVEVLPRLVDVLCEKCGARFIGSYCNGLEFVEDYRSSVPRVIFMNYFMPKMNGVGAVKVVRQTGKVS